MFELSLVPPSTICVVLSPDGGSVEVTMDVTHVENVKEKCMSSLVVGAGWAQSSPVFDADSEPRSCSASKP